MRSPQPTSRWWDREVGYEVYLRSFADGNGDGVGDLPGLTQRLDYLAWLGVGVVWITPFYPSPMADFGYDVADYTDVDPLFGTLEDFDTCLQEAHRLDLRVLVDLVPNHTSDQHPWFVSSRADPDDDTRGYYHWRDPSPGGGPPNNWVSHFGGPAWTLDPDSGQYYLHLFLPEQPDLNWSNPRLVREFDEVLRFWLDRGVDGFRVDVAQGLVKNMLMPDNPQRRDVTEDMSPRQAFSCYEHRYDLDQSGNSAIYRRWRAIVEEYDALLLGEVYLRDNDPNRVSRYVANQDGLHRAFYFAPMHTPWTPEAMWSVFRDALDAAPRDFSWAASSHDDPRAPSRFGGGQLGRDRALAYSVLLLALPGLPFLYQGDELGLEDVEVPQQRWQDPVAVRSGDPADGRDPFRTPMPWKPGPTADFTAAEEPWLPVGRGEGETVAAQRDAPDSVLHAYRRLLAARRDLPDLHGAELQWVTQRGAPVIAFRRGDCLCAVNLSDAPETLSLPQGYWRVVFSSRPAARRDPEGSVEQDGETISGSLTLSAPEGVLLFRQ